MQIAIRLRWKARVNLTAETVGGVVLLNAGADKINAGPGSFRGRGVATDLHHVRIADGGHSALHAEVVNGNPQKIRQAALEVNARATFCQGSRI